MSDRPASVGPLEGVLVIAGRELGNYVDSKIAYVYAVAFVVLANSIFMNEFFLTGTVDMSGFFDLMPLLLPVFLPAVTMRLWAEERKQRTIEMLLTMPIRPGQAVLGKYLAALALFGLFLLGSLPIAVMLFALGDPDPGLIFSGYLGVFLFGAMLLALGTFLSALSSDQIVAFVTTTVAGFLLVLSGDDRVVAVLDGLFPGAELGTRVYESFSSAPHFDAFVRGVVGLPALVYFTGLSALFLWICALVLERQRQ
ncbi:MAG: ABC transporter permease [Planctomycetota bacterium]|nr:MAG: ABC transporter permease [Planctomycetota bacterium]